MTCVAEMSSDRSCKRSFRRSRPSSPVFVQRRSSVSSAASSWIFSSPESVTCVSERRRD